MPTSAFTRGWKKQVAERNRKIPDAPPQPPRCDYPGCEDWGHFGYGIAGIEGLGKRSFFHMCGKHRLREDEEA
jgi:hypothetical protein